MVPPVLAGSAVPAAAQTAPWITIDVRTLASPNPFLLAGTDNAAVMAEASLRAEVTFTPTDNSTIDVDATIADRYHTRLYDNVVLGRVDAIGRYRDDERVSAEAGLTFARDLAIDLLTSSIEAAADPTSTRIYMAARGSVSWQPDEYSRIRPEFLFEKSSFDRTLLLGDTRSALAAISYRRRVSEDTALGARTGAIFGSTEQLGGTSAQLFYITIEHRLNARWRMTAELGAERNAARIETSPGVVVRGPARILPGGRAEICREAPGPVMCLAGSLNSEVSGLGGLQRRAIVSASVSHRLAERSTIDLSADYQRTATRQPIIPDFDAIRVTATVERQMSQHVMLGGTVRYLRRRLIDGSNIGAGFAGVQIRYATRPR